MRSVRALAALPLAVLALGACGDDSASAPTTASVVAISATLTTAPVLVQTTIGLPASTTVDNVIAGNSSADGPLGGPVQIDVIVGHDSGPGRVEYVLAGAEITLNITNPDAADEFHVHTIDLEQAAKAGQMATLNFTIAAPGSYEVESHVTQGVLLVIEAT